MATSRMFITLAAAILATMGAGCSDLPTSPSQPLPSTEGDGTVAGQQSSESGNSPYQLGQAGWHCVDVPFHGVHCEDPHWAQNGIHIQVKVFDTTDVESQDATFLGTESLIRSDRYHGQPCLPGHGDYFLIPAGPRAGYYACHHFDF